MLARPSWLAVLFLQTSRLTLAQSDQTTWTGTASLAEVVMLLAMSAVSISMTYATSILLARALGPEVFGAYAVAVVALAGLAQIAEAGTGKHALRVMPAFRADRRWGLASGYLRFSLTVVITVSALLATVVSLAEGMIDHQFGNYPLGIAILFLPFVAAAAVTADFIMAEQASVAGTFVTRVIIPGVTLAMVLASIRWSGEFGAAWAVVCYGSGGLAGLAVVAYLLIRRMPEDIWSATPEYRTFDWLRECLAAQAMAFLLAWIFKVGILILEILPVSNTEVARLAAAMETACLILLLSKSTDKLYLPRMSIVIASRDWHAGAMLRRSRRLLVGTICCGFLALVVVYGRQILSLFGGEFVAGYPALCYCSIGTCAWTLFSLDPEYLRLTGRVRLALTIIAAGAAGLAILTAILGLSYGATGAAIAFCTASLGTVLTMLSVAVATHAADRRGDRASRG